MYRTRLLELCQKWRWAPPEFTCNREGPDHDPRFRATVIVNGAVFVSSELPSMSSKAACNEAALAAFNHFTSARGSEPPMTELSLSPPPKLPMQAVRAPENGTSYKSSLQIYAQKFCTTLPSYRSILEGPSHCPSFKVTVTIDGQTFESPQYFNTIREAENAAAQVALQFLPREEKIKDASGFYKNFLQELMQKERLPLPVYTTVKTGLGDIPMYSSTVHVKGEMVKGESARTKKQAEINAAKIALDHFQEIKQGEVSCQQIPNYMPQYSSAIKTEYYNAQGVQGSLKIHEDEIIAGVKLPSPDNQNSRKLLGVGTPTNTKQTVPSANSVTTVSSGTEKINCTGTMKDTGTVTYEKVAVVSMPVGTEVSARAAPSSLLCNRIRVYPRKTNLLLPENATLLPFSDELWVAVVLDSSNHEDDDWNTKLC